MSGIEASLSTPSTERLRIYQSIGWSESHGVRERELGAVEDYIQLLSDQQPRNCLVIGSGCGFVPYVLLDNSNAQVVLVDALIGETGNGSPMDFCSTKGSFYNVLKPFAGRWLFVEALSRDFFEISRLNSWKFDFIFVDGDHSETAVVEDFRGALSVASPGSLILFHDTNLPWVREVADRELGAWRNIGKGTGTGVFRLNESPQEAFSGLLAGIQEARKMKSALKEARDANRWNYLLQPEFQERFRCAETILVKHFGALDDLNVLEIGGNPSPFSAFLLQKGHKINSVNIEPSISSEAKESFKIITENGGEISSSLKEIQGKRFDVFIFFGIDLSLSRDFDELKETYIAISQLVAASSIVILEAPDYTPSRLLQKAFISKCQICGVYDMEVPMDIGKTSISSAILRRRLVSALPGALLDGDKYEETPSILPAIARLYSLAGAPAFENEFDLGTWGTDEVATFLGFPKESDNGNEFCWLPDSISFKVNQRVSHISLKLFENGCKYASPAGYSFFYSTKFSGGSLQIDISVLGKIYLFLFKKMRLHIKLPYFVPSDFESSSDSRRLSYPVTTLSIS